MQYARQHALVPLRVLYRSDTRNWKTSRLRGADIGSRFPKGPRMIFICFRHRTIVWRHGRKSNALSLYGIHYEHPKRNNQRSRQIPTKSNLLSNSQPLFFGFYLAALLWPLWRSRDDHKVKVWPSRVQDPGHRSALYKSSALTRLIFPHQNTSLSPSPAHKNQVSKLLNHKWLVPSKPLVNPLG
jgi:hypothetical protein